MMIWFSVAISITFRSWIPPPPIDGADGAASLGDDPGDAVQRPGYRGLVRFRGQDQHGLVLSQRPTSSGLDGPHGGSRMWRGLQSIPGLPGRDPSIGVRHLRSAVA